MERKNYKGIAEKFVWWIIGIIGVAIFIFIVLMLTNQYMPGFFEGLGEALRGLVGLG